MARVTPESIEVTLLTLPESSEVSLEMARVTPESIE